MRYGELIFKIKLEKSVLFRKNPSILFRSILGKELKRLSCVLKQSKHCSQCVLAKTCVYSWFFETNIVKDNNTIPGRNKGSHPFVPFIATPREPTDSLDFYMIFIEKSLEYIPYIYYALKRAGEAGIFKERIKFNIEDILSEGKSILDLTNESIDTSVVEKCWNYKDFKGTNGDKTLTVNFLSPFRFKKMGAYQDKFSYENLITAAERRIQMLAGLFANEPFPITETEKNIGNNVSVSWQYTGWKNLSYFSRRQNSRILLGGIVGQVELNGTFSDYEMFLLNSAEKFHIGKNISFGLGRISLKQEEHYA